jgi:hypothetical protein
MRCSNIGRIGLAATRTKWENHWNTALTDNDLNWLSQTARCNMIRLPIGWFTLGPDFCSGTPFAGDPAQVYVNAWAAVRDIVQRCYDNGIGVLIDLHAVPGGANPDIHSGTSSGKADLWGNAANLALATKCVVQIAKEASSMKGIVGVQLCNEAATGAAGRGMYDWYGSAIWEISRVNIDIPVYISDAWDIGPCITFVKNMNPIGANLNPVIIDTHKYYTFSDFDKSQSPQQIIDRIPTEIKELDGQDGNVFDKGAVGVLVGEYSCVLDPQIWNKVSTDQIPSLKRQFGIAQSKRWQDRSVGSSFWTFKMDWMDGGDWGFKQQTNDSNIAAPPYMSFSASDVRNRDGGAAGRMASLHDEAYNAHVSYWNQTAPSSTFEHQRYSDGWHHGWRDGQSFFVARSNGVVPGVDGGDKIGSIDIWTRKRMLQTQNDKGHASFGWEWEQGFRKGLADYYSAVGV